jgi:uncharacterized membrane protein
MPAAASTAYARNVAATLAESRTLVGADLVSLPRIRSLRAPVVSIGGAGTFGY